MSGLITSPDLMNPDFPHTDINSSAVDMLIVMLQNLETFRFLHSTADYPGGLYNMAHVALIAMAGQRYGDYQPSVRAATVGIMAYEAVGNFVRPNPYDQEQARLQSFFKETLMLTEGSTPLIVAGSEPKENLAIPMPNLEEVLKEVIGHYVTPELVEIGIGAAASGQLIQLNVDKLLSAA
jgi:hypothetical protein